MIFHSMLDTGKPGSRFSQANIETPDPWALKISNKFCLLHDEMFGFQFSRILIWQATKGHTKTCQSIGSLAYQVISGVDTP